MRKGGNMGIGGERESGEEANREEGRGVEGGRGGRWG